MPDVNTPDEPSRRTGGFFGWLKRLFRSRSTAQAGPRPLPAPGDEGVGGGGGWDGGTGDTGFDTTREATGHAGDLPNDDEPGAGSIGHGGTGDEGGDASASAPRRNLTRDVAQRLVAVARREHALVAGSLETEARMRPFLEAYWAATPEGIEWTPRTAWSAAFISFCAHEAGAGETFTRSVAHWRYIIAGIEGETDPSAPFPARRVEDYAPQLGDIVCYHREKGRQIGFDTAFRSAPFQSHGDIVVGVRAGAVDVIGGNVSNTVTLRSWATDAAGRVITPSPGGTEFFAIIAALA